MGPKCASRLFGANVGQFPTFHDLFGASGVSQNSNPTIADQPPVNLNISLEQPDKKLALFGSADRFLRMIRDAFGVQLVNRDEDLRISGDNAQVTKAAAVLEQLQKKLRRQDWLTTEDVTAAIGKAAIEPHERVEGEIDVYARGHAIKPKTAGQKRYIDAMLKHDLTFCVGPAGTGKTYLAVAVAANMLKTGQAKRLVLARPGGGGGGRVGFVPGGILDKGGTLFWALFF